MRMLRGIRIVVLVVGLGGSLSLPAQAPLDSAARRFRFAEMTLGLDVGSLPAGRTAIGDGLPARFVPRFTIGGLHFWGHADFAVTIPLSGGTVGSGATKTSSTGGVETRGRWYVRPLAQDGISPFIGGGLGAVDVTIGDGPREYRPVPMGQAGLAWRRGGTLFEAGWSLRPQSTLDYPSSRTTTSPVTPSQHAVWIGAHRILETTGSLEPIVRSGAAAAAETRMRAAGQLSGPSLAIGPSSLILTGPSTYNREQRPWLATRPRSGTALDLGLGWYFDRPDVHVNLAWRSGAFDTEAFDFSQENRRQSLALEAYRFLFDYHGFVPFVGPVVSLENLRTVERDGGVTVARADKDLVAGGITFGWDIRPTRTQQWILRTNLRYFPRLRVPMPSGEQALDQLEFNYIQFVWYPRR